MYLTCVKCHNLLYAMDRYWKNQIGSFKYASGEMINNSLIYILTTNFYLTTVTKTQEWCINSKRTLLLFIIIMSITAAAIHEKFLPPRPTPVVGSKYSLNPWSATSLLYIPLLYTFCHPLPIYLWIYPIKQTMTYSEQIKIKSSILESCMSICRKIF